MFLEVNKKFVEFDKFNDTVKDMKRQFDKIQSDTDKMKVNIDNKSDKKEFLKIVDRLSDFEKHTDNVLKLLDERSKNVKQDLFSEFERIKKILEKKQKVNFADEEAKLKEEEEKQEKPEEKKGMMSGVVGKLKGEDRKIVSKPLEEDAEEKKEEPAEPKKETSEESEEESEE